MASVIPAIPAPIIAIDIGSFLADEDILTVEIIANFLDQGEKKYIV